MHITTFSKAKFWVQGNAQVEKKNKRGQYAYIYTHRNQSSYPPIPNAYCLICANTKFKTFRIRTRIIIYLLFKYRKLFYHRQSKIQRSGFPWEQAPPLVSQDQQLLLLSIYILHSSLLPSTPVFFSPSLSFLG